MFAYCDAEAVPLAESSRPTTGLPQLNCITHLLGIDPLRRPDAHPEDRLRVRRRRKDYVRPPGRPTWFRKSGSGLFRLCPESVFLRP